jgi:hypothetical protein
VQPESQQNNQHIQILTTLDAAQYEKQREHWKARISMIRQAYYEVELLIPKIAGKLYFGNVEELIKLLSTNSQGEPGYFQQYANNTRRLLRQSLQQALTSRAIQPI